MCAAAIIDPGKHDGSQVFSCGDGYSYFYNKRRVTDEGAVVWNLRCHKYYRINCRGTALFVQFNGEEMWENGNYHLPNCEIDHDSHEERLLVNEIRQAARTRQGYERPRQFLERIGSRYHPFVTARVRVARVRSTIRRARMQLYPNLPNNLVDLGNVLGDNNYVHLTTTLDGSDSIYSATVGEADERSVVFVSQRMLRFLGTVKTVFADATFSSTPRVGTAKQVYQIVTVVRDNVIPIVQAVMERKTRGAYQSILMHLHNICPAFQPRQALMDFEDAECQAWMEVYPMCSVSGCYVHHVRDVYKKAGTLGLRRADTDPNITALTRYLFAIPLLPQPLIKRGFSLLLSLAHRWEVFDEMVDLSFYYMSTWIESWRIEVLSVFLQAHRTSNAVESSHYSLRLETGPHHPCIWTFIEGLRRYEQRAFADVTAFERGLSLGRGRKASAILNDVAICNYTQDLLQGTISIKRFLMRASRRVTDLLDHQP